MIPTNRVGNTGYFFNERNEPKDIASEIWIQVFSGVSRQEVNASFLTCKCWRKIITEDSFLNFKKGGNYFGKAKWNKYYGNIGEEPLLSKAIYAALLKTCTFWTNKTVKKTHLLVLIPETVNGKPYHLNSLSELIKSPKTGSNDTKYTYYNKSIKKELGSKSQPSHWVLMTKDVIPNSQNKSYDDQKKLVATHAKTSEIPYVLPTALEATTAILMNYVETREYIYTDDKKESGWTYTRCQEKMDNNQWPAVIGGFSSEGLFVSNFSFCGYHILGVGGLRKF